MRHSLLATAVIATAIIGVSAATQAAEENAPAPQPTEQAAPPSASPDFGPDRGPDTGLRPPHMRRMPGPDVLALATKLSAAEIYLGVTPEQLGPWRAYTTALIDLVSPGPERNPLPPMPGEGKAKPEPRLAGEELAGIIAQKAEKAKALQDAAAALKPKLSPQQVLKLAELERALMPPPPAAPARRYAAAGSRNGAGLTQVFEASSFNLPPSKGGNQPATAAAGGSLACDPPHDFKAGR